MTRNSLKVEWKEIMSSEDGLAYVRGRWIEIDREKLAEALAHWKRVESDVQKAGISFIEGMRLLAGAPLHLDTDRSVEGDGRWAFVDAGAWLSGVITGLRNPEGLSATAETGDFRGTLRPYQKTGRNWLWFLSQLGLGACLADDMGLGKTVQVLSLLSTLKESGSTGETLTACAAGIASGKLEVGNRTFYPAAPGSLHPSFGDRRHLCRRHERKIGQDLRRHRPGAYHIRNAAETKMACAIYAGGL